MRAVVQRTTEASVRVAETVVGSIGTGFCVLLAVETGDDLNDARWMAKKVARLRIFPDEEGRTNLDLAAVGGAVLMVSQFTLAAECSHGNRPSFVRAADPTIAIKLIELVIEELRVTHSIPVETGRFAATMEVTLVNDGPFTVLLETPRRAAP